PTPTPTPRGTPTATPTPTPKLSGNLPTLQELAAPFQSPFDVAKLLRFRDRVLARFGTEDDTTNDPDFLDPGGAGGGGRALSFSQTEMGARLAASLGLDTERAAGRERLKLESTLHALAVDLLPPEDVETAMAQVRSGRVVKSKLAFQAVLENLADAARNAERRADLALQEENEKRTLTQARSRIIIDTIGRDVGAAVLFALGGVGGNE
ncbi:hypothetical protein LCGC14_2673170, partial [marine sediment metagenome]